MSAPSIQSNRAAPQTRGEERKGQNQKMTVQEEKTSAAAAHAIVVPTPAELAKRGLEKKKAAANKDPTSKDNIIDGKIKTITMELGVEAADRIKPKLAEILSVEMKETDSFDVIVETVIKNGLQELAIGQMENLQEQLKKALRFSDDLKEKLKNLTLADQSEFMKKITAFDETVVIKLVEDTIPERRKLVFRVLQGLNLLTGSASARKLQMRNDVEAKWNSICLDDYRLKWELQFIQKASSLMPKLTDLHDRLQKFMTAVTEEKRGLIDNGKDPLIAEKISKSFDKNIALFKSFDEEMKATDQEIRKFIVSLLDQKLLQEYLVGFAFHNDEVKERVTEDLKKLIAEINAKCKEHWNALITRWEMSCKDYCEMSIQVDQLGSINKYGIGMYSTKLVTKLRSWVVEGWAPMSVAFDPSLRPVK